jgi:hypothetical protein
MQEGRDEKKMVRKKKKRRNWGESWSKFCVLQVINHDAVNAKID